jgi:hypothetical protein
VLFLLLSLPRSLLIFLALLYGCPGVTAMSDGQPFPQITFKAFNNFVVENFSSQISLTTVLLVLFSLTENSDLLNLHACQKNPYLPGEKAQTASGWMKSLARALNEHLGDNAKALFKTRELPQSFEHDELTIPVCIKLDKMADALKLKPTFSNSGKMKHKLSSVSHQEIAAVHVICPTSVECEDTKCSPHALHQDTRLRDIPHVTLIKGTNIYKNVSVLSGMCVGCNTRYYADHESIIQESNQKTRVYLNSAKYMKIGQHIWVDRSFSNAVVNGMYSFHGSAAAYTEYWNNTFGLVNLDHSAKLK